MTSDQVVLIQQSFAQVRPIADQAAALFYGRLFEIAPETKPLFKGDIVEQGRKLMATLGVVVNGLGNLETVLPAASALAKRHVAFGVEAGQYASVGDALLWTLERGLGPAWTPDETPETKKIFEGHMANIKAMAASGKLVIAGPTDMPVEDRTAVAGIFLFDVPNKADVEALLANDPAIAAKRLVPEILPWYSPAGLTYPGKKP